MFSFLSPLDFQVWLCVATSLLGVSIVLFIVSRLTPYDWESSHPCDPNTEELENQMSLLNCVWFSLGSVLQQGSDILPKYVVLSYGLGVLILLPFILFIRASSTRIIAAMWWFFTLIMASTYTANLAAFLTSQQMGSEIKDVNDLASQNAVKYGCKKEGSTEQFFKVCGVKSTLQKRMLLICNHVCVEIQRQSLPEDMGHDGIGKTDSFREGQ